MAKEKDAEKSAAKKALTLDQAKAKIVKLADQATADSCNSAAEAAATLASYGENSEVSE